MPRSLTSEEGNRYGRLLVRYFAGSGIGKVQGATWLCDCDCGSERVVLGTDLRRKKVVECRECAARSRRNLQMFEAVERAGNPPCDKGCEMRDRCYRRRLACDIFSQWVQQHGPLKNKPPNPAMHMPNHKKFMEIYPNDKGDEDHAE